MDLKRLEQAVKIAATHYYYAKGDKAQRMDDLLKATKEYLENGGETERLQQMLSEEKEGSKCIIS